MTQPTAFQQGRYTVRHEISRDACGILLLAQDQKMASREVLIRQLPDSGISAAQLQRVAQLNHAILPSVYDLFEENGHRYLVSEHPTGQTLADIALGPRLKEGVVVAWARQVALGLSYLHQQIPPLAHGDVRPSNIILQEGRRIKLIGGTPAGCSAMAPSRYSAPEQWSGAPGSPAADIYALGATLHHLLTSTDPNTQPLMAFAPPDVRRPDLTPSTAAAIVRALSQQPDQRFPTVDAFIQALGSAGGSDQSSGDLPVIGFTPPVMQGPADGPTQRYTPSPSTPIPVPSGRSYAGPEQGYSQQYPSGHMDGYTNPGVPAAASRLPTRPAQGGGGRSGLVVLGVLLLLLLLGGGGWLAFRFLGSGDDPSRPTDVALNTLPTTTREEGRLLTDPERTATALALNPPTTFPTFDSAQATADAIQTSTSATSAAVTNDLEAIYLRGIAYEETGQFALAASDYDAVLRRDPTYKDTQIRRDRIQILLSATATAETDAALAANATATAAAEPTATPTAEPPTPTPVGQLLGDTFDAPQLDPSRWFSTPNNGSVAVADGALQLSSSSGGCFPVVQPLTGTLFPQANFDLNVTFRYSDVTPLGTGFMLGTEMPANCGPTDRAGVAWGGVWQDSTQGLIVEFHRQNPDEATPKDIRYQYSPGTIDLSEHTLTIQRRGIDDTYILDGNVLFTEFAGPAPQVLWFGNPFLAPADGAWTGLNILAVELRTQP
jgi:serine/threonine protein kinase